MVIWRPLRGVAVGAGACGASFARGLGDCGDGVGGSVPHSGVGVCERLRKGWQPVCCLAPKMREGARRHAPQNGVLNHQLSSSNRCAMNEQIDIAVDLGVVAPPLPEILSLRQLVEGAPLMR